MDKFCRACLTLIIDVHQSTEDDNKRKMEHFMYVTSINVSDNDLHSFELCENCTQILQLASEFKKRCHISDEHLSNFKNNKGDLNMFGFLAYLDDIQKIKLDTNAKNDCLDNESNCMSISNVLFEIENEDICAPEEIINAVINKESNLEDTINSFWLQGDEDKDANIGSDECFSPYLTPVPGNHCPEKQLVDPKLVSKKISGSKETFTGKVDPYYSCEEFDPRQSPTGASTPIITDILKGEHNEQDNCAKYKCAMCEEKFVHFNKYRSHCLETHGVKIPRKVNRKPQSCEYCGKVFSDPSNLKRHLLVHTRKDNFKCDLCSLVFKTSREYKLHTRAHNIKTNGSMNNRKIKTNGKYLCPVCSATRTTYPNFVAHQKTHEEKGSHVCKICEKRFYRKYDLDLHTRRHSGEKPFSCNMCPAKFARSDKLVEHIRIHTNERVYACTRCDEAFLYYPTLKRHEARCTKFNLKQI